MQVEIKKLLEKNAQEGAEISVSGPVDKNKIDLAEKALGVTFPPSYKKYLEEFGAIEIDNYSIAGLTQRDVGELGDVVAFTRYAREEFGLPSQYVALDFKDGDDFLCIDTSQKDASSESPIVLINPVTKRQHGSVVSPSFGDHLTAYLSAE